MLICTRFGLGVKDRAWFDHRLALFSAITVPSLKAQDDQGFHWALFVDADLPTDVRLCLERLLAPFESRAFLHSESTHTSQHVLALARSRNLVDDSGHVLTARIDDDDAWHRSTVKDIRRRVRHHLSSNAQKGVGITFEYGLEWIMYEMIDVDRFQREGRTVMQETALRPYRFPFHSMSVFVFAALADELSAISTSHPRMPDLLRSKGYDVEVVADDAPMWLYCRHKQAATSVRKADSDQLMLGLSDLADLFGLDEASVDRYLRSANDFGYAVIKRTDSRLTDLKKELRQIQRELASSSGHKGAKLAKLEEEEVRLTQALKKMSANIVGDPLEAPKDS
jgi:hypothetical protein